MYFFAIRKRLCLRLFLNENLIVFMPSKLIFCIFLLLYIRGSIFFSYFLVGSSNYFVCYSQFSTNIFQIFPNWVFCVQLYPLFPVFRFLLLRSTHSLPLRVIHCILFIFSLFSRHLNSTVNLTLCHWLVTSLEEDHHWIQNLFVIELVRLLSKSYLLLKPHQYKLVLWGWDIILQWKFIDSRTTIEILWNGLHNIPFNISTYFKV